MKLRTILPSVLVTVGLGLSALACGPAVSGAGATSAPVGRDISGTYDVAGINLEGNRYKGVVVITHDGPNQYTLNWTIGVGTQAGTGTLNGDTLTATWADEVNSGDVTYTLQPDGSLSGDWTQKGKSGTGTETLTPQKTPTTGSWRSTL